MRIWLEVSKISLRNADIGRRRKPKSLHNNKRTFDSSLGRELCASEEHRAQALFLRHLPLTGSLKQTQGMQSSTAALPAKWVQIKHAAASWGKESSLMPGISSLLNKFIEGLMGAGHCSGYKGYRDKQDNVSDFMECLFQDRRQAMNKYIL